jgi:nicotinate phosphoribosyltransferase
MREEDIALFTDLYELKMAQACLASGMTDEACFSLSFRSLPESRNFVLACGLQEVLDRLEQLHFTPKAIAYLRSLRHFSDEFLRYLADFRFRGSINAVPEGSAVFPNEPLLEVVGPLPQAQLVETLVLNVMHSQSVLASKAARVVLAAAGRPVMDFGARRIHGLDGAVAAARAFYIAGVRATSNVLAGLHYGLPLAGTEAHSFIQACDDELSSFRAFVREFPDTVLLVDTYDTLAGVDHVIALARQLGAEFRVRGVRLDSGDLAALAPEVRRRLDAAGLPHVQVFVSGGLDEWRIKALLDGGAPVGGFGVGTDMGVSGDAPSLDMVYKLTSYRGRGRMKLSTNKVVLPGRKQVFRRRGDAGFSGDVIALSEESLDGEPLLRPVMRDGRRLSAGLETLDRMRQRAERDLAALPRVLRDLAPAQPKYPIHISDALARHRDEVLQQLRRPSG